MALHGTAFGRVLLGKLAMALAMVALSVVHDLFLGPRLVAALAAAGSRGPSGAARVAGLRGRTAHLARLNLGLGLLVVAFGLMLVCM